MSRRFLFILTSCLIACGDNSPIPEPSMDAAAVADLALLPDAANDLGVDAAVMPSEAALFVDDGSFQFDPVAGAPVSAPASFKFTNKGGQPTAALAVDIHGNDSARFQIVTDECSGKSLAAGSACRVAVTLGSPTAGDCIATLRVHGDPGGVARVDLSGRVSVAALGFSPATLDLGAVFQGASSAPLPLDLKNSGGATSGVLSFGALSSGFAVVDDACTGKTLAGGASCRIKVAVTAGADSAGAIAATLTAAAQPGGTASATLSATARRAATISVTSIDFGTLGLLFGTAAPQTMRVTNGGDQAAVVQRIDTTFTSGLTIDSTDCVGKTLQPNASCQLRVGLSDDNRWAVTSTLSVHVDNGHDGSATVKVAYVIDGYELFLGNYYSALGTLSSSDGQSCVVQDCNFKFHTSTPHVTLTAQPLPGNHFTFWDNSSFDMACGGSTNPVCSISFTLQDWTSVAEPRFAKDSP